MAIEDRNLSIGTKLWAKYKGSIHTAEVIAVLGDASGRVAYQLPDGSTFKSPSAAGTAITGKACNGWAFWTVGEPGDQTGSKTSTVNAVPKPERKSRKAKADAASEAPDETPTDEPTPAAEGGIECGECHAILPDAEAAAAHLDEVHAA
jgi:hypothetical protein